MLFQRRHPRSRLQRLRALVWPARGFARAGRYLIHRLYRLPASPHAIAAGFASGAAVSFTPFLGFHFLLAFALAWIVRGNMLAAALGTVVGNPWTFPLILPGIYRLGVWLMGEQPRSWVFARLDIAEFVHELKGLLVPMTVGAIIPATLAWFIAYVPLKRLVARVQERRRARRAARLAEIEATVSRIRSQTVSPS